MFWTKSVSEEDLQDLHGKVVIVTGGNGGIGYATVQFLVRKGAKVYLAARNESRVMDAIERLKEEGINDGSLHFLHLDLGDPRSAKNSASKFLQSEKRLDILVNNAAKIAGPYHRDSNGLLDVMVTNHISPFVFTENLLPLLKSTASETDSDVRIINVSSVAHTSLSPTTLKGREVLNKDFGDSFKGYLYTYGYSKLANILYSKELQRRFDREGVPITCISLHPGNVDTPGAAGFVKLLPTILLPLTKLFVYTCLSSPREGAMTSAFAAASKEVGENREKYKGAYLVPISKLASPTKYATDERLGKELYETTVEIVNELGI